MTIGSLIIILLLLLSIIAGSLNANSIWGIITLAITILSIALEVFNKRKLGRFLRRKL